MNKNLFCFRCEQTDRTGLLQDALTGALIGLARASESSADLLTPETDALIQRSLSACADSSPDDAEIQVLLDQVHAEKARLVPDCASCRNPCGHNDDYDLANLWNAQEDIRSLKVQILSGIRDMAARACRVSALGYRDEEVNRFFYRALFTLGEDTDAEHLLPIARQVEEMSRKAPARRHRSGRAL